MRPIRLVPAGVVLGGVLLVTLLYFAVTDFLYMGRLAAYVAIVEMPELPVSAERTQPPLPHGGMYFDAGTQSSPAIDATEFYASVQSTNGHG